jgi:hypothetical protein
MKTFFLVQNQMDLIDDKKEIGLFLIASPSLGALYANWLMPLARVLHHTQADGLRFTQDNAWLIRRACARSAQASAVRGLGRARRLVRSWSAQLSLTWASATSSPRSQQSRSSGDS